MLIWTYGTIVAGVLAGLVSFPSPQIKPNDNEIAFKAGEKEFRLELVKVKAGKFKMGASEQERKLFEDRFGPELFWEVEHEVQISAFGMSKFPVTRGQFRIFAEASGYKTEAETDGEGGCGYDSHNNSLDGRCSKLTWRECGIGQTDRHPVVNVTWNDAKAFCDWASKESGRTIRLPTEAEWEYACRAGTKTLYITGDDPESLKGYANVADASLKAKKIENLGYIKPFQFDDGEVFTSVVGQYKPNPWGLYDMIGNVKQWCQDGYRKDYENLDAEDPVENKSTKSRILRGCSWRSGQRECCSSVRAHNDPDGRSGTIGFRIVALP